ncbi:hypothetical protein MSL71_30800 [Desulfoluna butyratoxydans]|uniref:Uncharacterized protein n=1 Tax=Desulfoluna butyratoxydans TaxID=231438 RepID=A0A4U8YVJ1_9BACT|nr:hypothetical protein MSL71_30800 [Desulfoluna butyratoxydans]
MLKVAGKSKPPAARWSHLESLLRLRIFLRFSGKCASAFGSGFARYIS